MKHPTVIKAFIINAYLCASLNGSGSPKCLLMPWIAVKQLDEFELAGTDGLG